MAPDRDRAGTIGTGVSGPISPRAFSRTYQVVTVPERDRLAVTLFRHGDVIAGEFLYNRRTVQRLSRPSTSANIGGPDHQ